MNKSSLADRLWNKKIAFFVTFFVVFTVSYLVLVAVDFVPEAPEPEKVATTTDSASVADDSDATDSGSEVVESVGYAPTELYIKRLDRKMAVKNPTSRTIADLDAALLEGVVRHPDSALANQEGNVFILGHSSYLPNVLNKNFQAFNGIQNLEWGDVIELTAGDRVFVYRVDKVYQARAQDVTVPIAGDEQRLTLATCNSFGSVDDRYIVEAKQVEVRTL